MYDGIIVRGAKKRNQSSGKGFDGDERNFEGQTGNGEQIIYEDIGGK